MFESSAAGNGNGAGTGNEDKAESGTAAHADGGGGSGTTPATGTVGAESEFKPMTEAEQNAWKARTKSDLVKQARKEVADEAKTAADAAAAAAAGDWEKLAQTRQAEIDKLKRELDTRDRNELRRTIALKHGLSDDLAKRLIGETADELEDDAKLLAKSVKPPKAADTETGDRSTRSATGKTQGEIEPRKATDPVPAYPFVPAGAVPIPNA